MKEVPIFVSRKISLSGSDWLRTGFDLWDGFENKSRDYFVFLSNPDLTEPVMHYASTERIAGMVRHVFTELGQPCRSRFQGWKLREDSKLVGDSAVMFWSGHSMRHFIPSVAASVDIGKGAERFCWSMACQFASVSRLHTYFEAGGHERSGKGQQVNL